jgi:hypothetical protein
LAGYSGTPLPKKLGIKEGFRVALIDLPEGFEDLLSPLPSGVEFVSNGPGPLDLVVLFTTQKSELERRFQQLSNRLAPAGMLWVAWPKKSSKVPTDLNENLVRDHGLEVGLVDTKVCAVTEVWSGLKFVYRLKDRPKASGPTARRAKG